MCKSGGCFSINRRYANLAIILILLIVVVYVDTGATIPFLNRGLPTVLGLDLRGGTQALLEVDLPATTDVTASQMSDARQIMSNRINGLGVSEAVCPGGRQPAYGRSNPRPHRSPASHRRDQEYRSVGVRRYGHYSPPVGTAIKTDLGTSASTSGTPAVPPPLFQLQRCSDHYPHRRGRHPDAPSRLHQRRSGTL